MKEQFKYGETEKEILDKIFEFETYCTQRFDSEHRVAMAVYDYVQQMKREYNGGAAGIKPKYIPKSNTMEETIEVPKQLLSDMLASMEKNNLARHNNMWEGADWPLTLEEFIKQGKMPKYYYELRKLLPKT